MNYLEKVKKLQHELENNDVIKVTEFEFETPHAPPEGFAVDVKDAALLAFYSQISSLKISWETKSGKDEDVAGFVNILPVAKVGRDWKEDVYDDDEAADSPKRFFHPVDFFAPEAAVGILHMKGQAPQMCFNSLGDELIWLGLTFDGYLTLLLEARGFNYWQMALVADVLEEENEEMERFKKHMPKLFPDFNYKKFMATYRALKID